MSNRNMENLVALVLAGQLAVDLWFAEQKAASAKDAYFARVRQYEVQWNDGERIKLDPGDTDQAELFAFTDEFYQAAQRAKKAVYSAKQKLRRACKAAAEKGGTA